MGKISRREFLKLLAASLPTIALLGNPQVWNGRGKRGISKSPNIILLIFDAVRGTIGLLESGVRQLGHNCG